MSDSRTPDLITAEELAARTGFSLQRIWYAARIGLLPSVRCGRRVFFNRDAVDAWIAGGKPQSTGRAS